MTKPYYELNEIDNLFFDLFGFYPTKEGQSYEKIVGAALKIIYSDKQITWDERKKGIYDKNTYQIDVGLYSIDGDNFMVEAKDHSKDNKKVSRPELDKVAGSLIELEYDSGLFFSATDYTRDARKKSQGSQINPNAKKISLYHLRPSKDEDKKGRVEVFKIKIATYEIDEKNTSFNPTIPDSAFDDYQKLGIPTGLKSYTQFYYDETSIHCKGLLHDDNDVYIGEYEFFKTLDKSVYQQAKDNNLTISGTWKVDSGYFQVKNLRTQIDNVQYKITFKEISTDFEVKSQGRPVLLIASEDGEINKLLTDHQLKGITFSDNGEILFDGRQS
jgi:hypothetical protein